MNRVRFVLSLSDADVAETRLGDDTVLRIAVAVVGVSSVLGLTAVGLMSPGTGVLDAVLIVVCSVLARWTLGRPGLRWLRLATWLSVGLVTAGLALAGAGTSGAGSTSPQVLLGTLVAGFIAATSAEQDGTRRSTLVNLALGLAVLALAAGIAPRWRSPCLWAWPGWRPCWRC